MSGSDHEVTLATATATPPRHVVQTYSYGSGEQDDQTQSSDKTKSKSQIIFDLIDTRQWEAVVRYLESNPQAVHCRQHVPNSIQYNLPLHEACRRQPPLHVINLLLKMDDDAVHTAGQYGFLPLHIACGSGASHEVVLKLLEIFPAATRCRDDVNESLPLHLAARWGASEKVLMEVLTTYPEGSLIRDAAGKTPLDHAKELPDDETKDHAISTLEIAPVLIAAAKSATRRIEHDVESRIRSVQEAHKEFIHQLEQRQEEEKTDFLAIQIQFHNDLAAEKERNCELAEVIIKLQNDREMMMSRHQETLQQRLEEQQKAFDAQWAKHHEELKALEMSIDDVDSSRSADVPPQLDDHQPNMEQVDRDAVPAMETKAGSAAPVSLETISRVIADYKKVKGQLDETTSELSKCQIRIKNLEDSVQEKEECITTLSLSLQREQEQHRGAITGLRQLEVALQDKEECIVKLSSSLETEQEQRQVATTHLRQLEVAVQEKEELILTLTSSLETEQKQHQAVLTHIRHLEVSHNGLLQELQSAKNEMNRLRSKADSQQQQLRDSTRIIRDQDRSMKNIKHLVASLCKNISEWSNHEEAPWMTESRQDDVKFTVTPPREHGIHPVEPDDMAEILSDSQTKSYNLPDDKCEEFDLCDEMPMSDGRGPDTVKNVSATFSQKSLKIDQKKALSTVASDQVASMRPSNLDVVIGPNSTTPMMAAKMGANIGNIGDTDANAAVGDMDELIENASTTVDQTLQCWEQTPSENLDDVNTDEVSRLSMDPIELENIQHISAILPEESYHCSDNRHVHDLADGLQVSQSVDEGGNKDENLGMEITVLKMTPRLNGSLVKCDNTTMVTEISNAEGDDNEQDISVINLVRDFMSIRSVD